MDLFHLWFSFEKYLPYTHILSSYFPTCLYKNTVLVFNVEKKKKPISFEGCLTVSGQLSLSLLFLLTRAVTVRTNFNSVILSSKIVANTSKSYRKLSLHRKLQKKKGRNKALEKYIV